MPLDLNLGAAFAATVNKPMGPWLPSALKITEDDGTLLKLCDVLSPLDKQAALKITNTKIANVYNTLAKGSIPVGNQSTNTSGQRLFVELNVTASKTVGTTVVLTPAVVRIDLSLPNDGDLTDANVESLVLAAYAALCTPAGAPRATTMMRGVLNPSG